MGHTSQSAFSSQCSSLALMPYILVNSICHIVLASLDGDAYPSQLNVLANTNKKLHSKKLLKSDRKTSTDSITLILLA